MKEESDDTSGLLAALLKAHKDIKAVFYLGSAALAVDLFLVLTGKGNLSELSWEGAGNAIGIVVLALILWAMLQNMVVPIASTFFAIVLGSFWISIDNRLFPNAGKPQTNPDDRLYVSLHQLELEIIRHPDRERIARYEKGRQQDNNDLVAARHVSYASAGTGLLVIASQCVQGSVLAGLSIGWWFGLLAMALAPWCTWTFTFVLKRRWIVDPELAGRLREELCEQRRKLEKDER